ncbi:MAG: GyrI-like domain-containing protein [Gammaproteobacteria bacterium]|nr:GyrI-like domain-containing protein [Gammaproteobacteria bacterium]
MNDSQIEHREDQHYVAIRAQVSREEMVAALPVFWPEVFGWLAEQGETPVGAPFIRYLRIAAEQDRYDIEVGIPVGKALAGEGRIGAGVFPAGRYATAIHTGPYDGLVAACQEVHAWVNDNDLEVDESETAEGIERNVQVESYLSDPGAEPDPTKWQTQIAYLLV